MEAALRRIVELDNDAHPGLSSWCEARTEAHNRARVLIAPNAKVSGGGAFPPSA